MADRSWINVFIPTHLIFRYHLPLTQANFDRSSLYVTVRVMRGNRCFMSFVGYSHRVGRVLSFFSSRRNWNSPNPSPAGEGASPLWFWGEGHTRWLERGWESPNSHEGTYTVVLYIYMNSVGTLKELYNVCDCSQSYLCDQKLAHCPIHPMDRGLETQ